MARAENRSPSIVDPLFNKKVFAAFVLFGAAIFSCLFWRASENRTPAMPPIESKVHADESPYERGYLEGRRAFVAQFAADNPEILSRSDMSYSSSHDAPPRRQETERTEEELRGYVDGYHSAGNSQHCPR
jgi:hypothetical protein